MQPSDEWNDGHAAYRDGLVRSENPHRRNSVAATDWLNGWNAALSADRAVEPA